MCDIICWAHHRPKRMDCVMRGTVIRCDKNLFVSVDFDFGNPIVPVSTCHNPMRTTGSMMPAEEKIPT